MNRPLAQSVQKIPKRFQEWMKRRKVELNGEIAALNTSSKVLINTLLGRPRGHRYLEEYRNSIPGKGLTVDPDTLEFFNDNLE